MSEETEKTCGNLDMAIRGLDRVTDNMVREIQRLRAENERLRAENDLAFLKIHEAIGDPDGDLSREEVVATVEKIVAVLEVMVDLRNMAKEARTKDK